MKDSERSNLISPNVKVILLPGGAKCGSTALRQFLSTTQVEMKIPDGRRLIYFRFWANPQDGSLKVLRNGEAGNIDGLIPASLQDLISAYGDGCLHDLLSKPVALLSEDEVMVVSNEYWGQELQEVDFKSCSHDGETPFGVSFLLFIRPQVELLVSTCLQWVIFDDISNIENATLYKVEQIGRYAAQLDALQRIGAKTGCVLLADDTPKQFCECTGLQNIDYEPSFDRVNMQFTPEVIHILLFYRFLVKNQHDQRYRRYFRNSRIWRQRYFAKRRLVFSAEMKKKTIALFDSDNAEMLKWLSRSDAELFIKRASASLADVDGELIHNFYLNSRRRRPNPAFTFLFAADAISCNRREFGREIRNRVRK